MVRVRRRRMALACAGVLVTVVVALGSAVAPGAARAATLSAADLEKQRATIAQTLQEASDDLGYYYRDDVVEPFGRWNLSLAAVKAKMMLYVSSGDSANVTRLASTSSSSTVRRRPRTLPTKLSTHQTR
jgi:hypothetical protein